MPKLSLIVFTTAFLVSLGGHSMCVVSDDPKSPQFWQMSASKKQVFYRGFADYKFTMGSIFWKLLERGLRDPDFRWMDQGGGAGIAAWQSLFWTGFIEDDVHPLGVRSQLSPSVANKHQVTVVSLEDLFSQLTQMSRADLLGRFSDGSNFRRLREVTEFMNSVNNTSTDQFRYLHGRSIIDYGKDELGQHNLITDLFGAFTYSEKKIEVLIKIVESLKPGGTAIILANDAFDFFLKKEDLPEEIDLSNLPMDESSILTLSFLLAGVPGISMPRERITDNYVMGPGSLSEPRKNMRIYIRPTSATLPVLRELASRIQYLDLIDNGTSTPQYVYSIDTTP